MWTQNFKSLHLQASEHNKRAHKTEPRAERAETKTAEKKRGRDKVSALANSGSIVHSSLLHLSSQGHSARVCSWITSTVCSSHNKWHCRVCTCWVGSAIHPSTDKKKTKKKERKPRCPTTLGGLRTGTLNICNLMYCSSLDPSQPPLLRAWQLTNVNSEAFRLRRRELFRLEMGSLFPLGPLFHTTIYKRKKKREEREGRRR